MPATETRLSDIMRQILSRTYTGLQLNVDKTLLGLFTSFVGRREFALSVVETTCLEETLFKVVRACMRTTVLRMILSRGGGGGGYLRESRVGRCGPAAQTLTLFKTRISNFPTLFKTECQFLIPCLRHLL